MAAAVDRHKNGAEHVTIGNDPVGKDQGTSVVDTLGIHGKDQSGHRRGQDQKGKDNKKADIYSGFQIEGRCTDLAIRVDQPEEGDGTGNDKKDDIAGIQHETEKRGIESVEGPGSHVSKTENEGLDHDGLFQSIQIGVGHAVLSVKV